MPDTPTPRITVDIDGLKWAARMRIVGNKLVECADELDRLEAALTEHDDAPPPPPVPEPGPDVADVTFAKTLKAWVAEPHFVSNHKIQQAAKLWLRTKGL